MALRQPERTESATRAVKALVRGDPFVLMALLCTTACGRPGPESVACGQAGEAMLRAPVAFDERGTAGPATITGDGPYTLTFDHGPTFELSQIAQSMPGNRGYLRFEVKWYGPLVPSFRLSQHTLTAQDGPGELQGVLWTGSGMLDGDFGEVRYSTRGTGQTFERCNNTVEQRDLLVEVDSASVRLGQEQTGRVGKFCARHETTSVFTSNAPRCPETPGDYSAGRIVRVGAE